MTAPARRHDVSVMSEARARCSCGWAVRGTKRYVTSQAERHAFDHNGNISIGGLQ